MPTKLRAHCILIGATSAIAEHCARLWVENRAIDLVLVGRNEQKLRRMAADLQIRSPQSTIDSFVADFTDPQRIQDFVAQLVNHGPVDRVLIAHGMLPDQQACQANLERCYEALSINALSPVLFAEAFAGAMQKANHGTLAIIGSVAGDRGRKSNYIYGAAKGLIERYTQGLQHRLAHSAVHVILIKPGPTHTPMAAHFSHRQLAPVEEVAQQIVAAIECKKNVLYTPFKWKWIMWGVRHLPSFIFNKINI